MSNIVGGCLCGAVRYRSDAEPVVTALCHCKQCQRQTSSAFSVIFAIPKGSLETEYQSLSAFEHTGYTGQKVTRRFCPDCGSPIVSIVGATPDIEWVKAGTLDDPSWLRPQMNIWVEDAQPWITIDQNLQNFEKNPPFG